MGRPGLTRHAKFARLARILRNDAAALGHLEYLWQVAYENGDDVLGDSGDVEYLAHWKGRPGVLVAALKSSGFVDEVGTNKFAIHDLWDHAPDYVRKRLKREHSRRETGEKLRHVAAVGRTLTGRCPPNGSTPAPAPAPAPALPIIPSPDDRSAEETGPLVSELLGYVQTHVKPGDWRRWFEPVLGGRLERDVLVLEVPDQVQASNLEANWRAVLEEWLDRELHQPVRVRFVAAQAAGRIP